VRLGFAQRKHREENSSHANTPAFVHPSEKPVTNNDLSMRSPALLVSLAGLALATCVLPAQQALAQDGAEASAESTTARPTNKALLEDFIHFVNTANYPLAQATGAEFVSRNVPLADVVKLVEEVEVERFEKASQRALKFIENPQLQGTAAQLLRSFEDGKLAQARDPEVIARNIQNLLGGVRAKLIASEGLKRAGEYAMPQLLEAYLQTQNAELAIESQRVMIDMGRQAIVPLSAGLTQMVPAQQEKVARLLGLIPYKMSVPFLADVAENTQSPNVREACNQALTRLNATPGNVPSLYRELARGYYGEKSEVTNFPGEEHQLLWSYAPQTGLQMQALRTPVYHEAMAMQLLERAMTLEAASGGINPDSLALWVASNYSRENDTPEGYVNPAYPVEGAAMDGMKPRRSAEYFGVAGGADVAQRVLALALSERDTPLARQAISAVERVAGSSTLGTTGQSPLVAALQYPERRVQTEAALAIAAARPTAAFGGSERVVPTLASAVTASVKRFAVVLAPDAERYQARRATLEKAGYTVLPQAQRLGELEAAMADLGTIELVVATGLAADRTASLIEEVRGTPKTSATPILVLVPPLAYAEQQRRFESDRTVALRPEGLADTALTASVDDLTTAALGGPVTEGEAQGYATRALAALRDLAVSQNSVLKVTDASGVLADALKDASEMRLIELGEVLSLTGGERAQRALADKALATEGDFRTILLTQVATNAKRFGNLLESAQIDQVLEIARTGSDREATAASALLGALNTPNTDMLGLVKGE
jgi:hypothetical protein